MELPDYTLVIQIVGFLVFWFLLSRLLFRPFLRLIEEREQKTEGVKAETAALIDEGERMRAEYESGIKSAWEMGLGLKEKIIAEGRQERERLLTLAREETARLIDTVRAEIRGEMQRGREMAAREAQEIARQIEERILERRIG